MLSIFTSLWVVLSRTFKKPTTVQYPEERPQVSPRFRGRIVLTRDPDGEERCVACYLCSSACPVDCIVIEADEDARGRRYPKRFRINFSRCIYCGMCEEACPTLAIQLTPDFEMAEYKRHNMVYEKNDLLISGTGKYEGYNFYRMSGLAIAGKNKGQAINEKPPVEVHGLMP